MTYEEKTISKNYIYKGRIISLHVDDIELTGGEKSKREVVDHNGAACVLYEENGSFVFVKQYRYAFGETVLEIPAGKLEKGEDPKFSAQRELEEETGIRCENLQHIFTLYPTPGYTNEKIYIYLAKNGEHVSAHLDQGEFLDAVWIKKEEIKAMLTSGEIHDSKTIVALQHYFLNE